MDRKRPVLPPMPEQLQDENTGTHRAPAPEPERSRLLNFPGPKDKEEAPAKARSAGASKPASASSAAPKQQSKQQPKQATASRSVSTRATAATTASSPSSAPMSSGRTRQAQLRLTRVDPWSVMKTSFLLSVALGVVWIVAVAIVWGVLGAAGVWDSINSMVGDTLGSDTGSFDISSFLGAGRVIGFTMLAAVLDVILITAIATLGAFLYNLAATLLGGIEVTLTEDR